MKKITIDKNHIKNVIKTKWKFMLLEFVVLAALLALDLTMKDYLSAFLAEHDGIFTLIPNFIDLHYSENTGAGFGSFEGKTVGLIILTSIVMFGVIAYLTVSHKEGEFVRIPLVLIVAGGVGNLVDRIALGYVRDFFEFTFVKFAIFNIADICVTVGAIMLVISLIYLMATESKRAKPKFEAEKESLVYNRDENETDSKVERATEILAEKTYNVDSNDNAKAINTLETPQIVINKSKKIEAQELKNDKTQELTKDEAQKMKKNEVSKKRDEDADK
ncbi:MAG: signal peptidase II [Clostridia bacterium]